MARAPIEIPADKWQRAYDYYHHHPSITRQTIADFLGVSLPTFNRLRRRWGWPLRAAALAKGKDGKEAVPQAEAFLDGEATAASLGEVARSLVRVTRSQIRALVKEQRAGRVEDHAKTAQTLASYAKTLTTAQALLEQEGSRLDDTEQHNETPRSIHELRDELARHLERVIAEEEARGSDGLLV